MEEVGNESGLNAQIAIDFLHILACGEGAGGGFQRQEILSQEGGWLELSKLPADYPDATEWAMEVSQQEA